MIAGMNFYTALVQVICLQIDGLRIPIRLRKYNLHALRYLSGWKCCAWTLSEKLEFQKPVKTVKTRVVCS